MYMFIYTIINIPICFLFLIYFLLISLYFFKNLKKNFRRINLSWLNLLILNFLFSILCTLYVLSLINWKDKDDTKGKNFNYAIRLFYFTLILFGLNNILENLIKSCLIYYSTSSFRNISKRNVNTNEVIEKELKVYLMNDNIIKSAKDNAKEALINETIFNKKIQIGILILMVIIDSITIYLYLKLSLSNNSTSNTYSNINFFYLIEIVKYTMILSSFIISVINIKLLNSFKKKLNSENFKCTNNIQQYITNQSKKICFDFLIYKTILDVMLCLPFILLLIVQDENIYLIIINYAVWLAYNLFLGNILLLIDRNNRISVNSVMKKIFISRVFFIKLGTNNGNNLNFNHKLISLDDFNINSSIKIRENMMHRNRDEISVDPVSEVSSCISSCSSREELNMIEKEKHFNPVNFYLIFKLLFNYFKVNSEAYEVYERKIKEFSEQEEIARASLNNSRQSNSNINRNKGIEIGIGIGINTVLVPMIKYLNLDFNGIFNTMEDIDVKEQFNKLYYSTSNYPNHNPNPNPNTNSYSIKIQSEEEKLKLIFHFESLFSDDLLQLYALYQICHKDILNSLQTDKNKQNFKSLSEKKYSDKNFNHFFSRDTFLYFEIYDKSVLNVLTDFVNNYKKYISDRIKDWRQTFIPLIIGVYNIKYLDYDKIIVLYRHPLAFSPFLSFKYWINISLNDLQEKIAISSSCAEIIDVKEIEVKDSILLHPEDHREVVECLKSDFRFLKKLPYFTDLTLNVFIINEVKHFLSTLGGIAGISARNNNNSNNNDNLLNDSDSRDFIQVLRKTEIFRETAIKCIEKSKKEFGSEIVTVLDKLVTNYVVDTRYIIKIYFSDLFKICDTDEGKNHSHLTNPSIQEHNKFLSRYLNEEVKKIVKCANEDESNDMS